MSKIDYRCCDVCGSKTYYDAELNWDYKNYPDTGFQYLGESKVLCRDCSKTHKVVIETIEKAG